MSNLFALVLEGRPEIYEMYYIYENTVDCPSAARVVCMEVDIFGTKTVSLNHVS
jgi:hypothetical protein